MRRITSEQIQEVLEIAGSVAAVLSGSCKDEIARLTTLKAEIDGKLKAVGGLDNAEKVKAEADAYAAKVKLEADERADGTKAAAKSLQEWQDRLASKQAVFDDAQSRFSQEQARHAADVARWQAGVTEQERVLASREVLATSKLEALERDRVILDERQKRFQERLAKASEPV